MRRRTCLDRLNRSFARRVLRLEAVANQIAGKNGHDIDRALAFVTIEALTTWSNFAREFYLSCAFAHPRTIGGHRVSHGDPTLVNERSALLKSIAVLKTSDTYKRALAAPRIVPRDEPTWHEKQALSKLASNLALSNDASVITALSYPSTLFGDLPTVRNFYAHRSHGSALKVTAIAGKKYGARSIKHPSELVNLVLPGKTQTLVQEWLGDMKQIGWSICQ